MSSRSIESASISDVESCDDSRIILYAFTQHFIPEEELLSLEENAIFDAIEKFLGTHELDLTGSDNSITRTMCSKCRDTFDPENLWRLNGDGDLNYMDKLNGKGNWTSYRGCHLGHYDSIINRVAQSVDICAGRGPEPCSCCRVCILLAMLLYYTDPTCLAGGGRDTEWFLKAFAARDDPAAEYIRYRPVQTAFQSRATMETARTWINDCSKLHKSCRHRSRHAASRTPPRRLLDVANNRVRIIETAGQDHDYLALSYCWGQGPHFQTTTSDLPDYLKFLPEAELPKTIKDAVHVTRELGKRYLWIDALCIIQDDANDKQAELSRMHEIYRGADFTLVAAAARGASEGFLGYKSSDPLAPKFAVRLPTGRVGKLSLVMLAEGNNLEDDHYWSTRGWTFQESLLSSRMLLFCKRDLVWKCPSVAYKTMSKSISSYRSMLTMPNGAIKTALQRADVATASTKSGLFGRLCRGRGGSSEQVRVWIPILHDYTARDLTNQDDRLKAVHGIAMELQKRWKDAYVYGIWKKSLRQLLIWRADGVGARHDASIPSWSWASIDSPVTFMEHLTAEIPDGEDEDWHRILFSAHLSPGSALSTYSFPYTAGGQLPSLSLTIKGRVLHDRPYEELKTLAVVSQEGGMPFVMTWTEYWDTEEECSGSGLAYVLLGRTGVGEADGLEAQLFWVLVVRAVGEATFERVGLHSWVSMPIGIMKTAWSRGRREKIILV